MVRLITLLGLLLATVQVTVAQTLPFADGEVDTETPYVGQPITYTLRVYTTEIIENTTVIEPPFFGFGRSRVEIEPDAYVETIDNINYNVIEQDYIIYPLRPGEITIDPFRIEIPETPFSDAQTVFNDAVTLTVQDYPQPAPASFINAVGQFEMQVSANPTTLNSGDALSLSVAITGSGNFEQMLAPILPVPDSWRVFDGQTSFTQSSARFGTKTFEWTVIVPEAGNASIPSIAFSYLNPQLGEYITITSTPIALSVLPASPAPEITVERTLIVLTPVPVPELMSAAGTTGLPAIPPIWVWIIWVIPPALALVAWGGKRRSSRRSSNRTGKTPRPRKQPGNRALNDLRKRLVKCQSLDPKSAYEEIANCIYAFISAKTGEATDSANIQEVIARLPVNYRDELTSCLEEASAGQYAPVTAVDVNALSKRVLRVCAAIDRMG